MAAQFAHYLRRLELLFIHQDFGGGLVISIQSSGACSLAAVCPDCNLRRCFPVNILPAWRHYGRGKEGKVSNLGEIVMSAAIEVASASLGGLGSRWAAFHVCQTSP